MSVIGTPYSGQAPLLNSNPADQGSGYVVASDYAGLLATEPYERWQGKLAASGATALVSDRIGQEWPAASAGFPCVCWKLIGNGAAPTDTEGWLSGNDLVQVDLLGDDFDVLRELARLVDESINDKQADGSWDTAHWRFASVRRVGPWRRIPWPDRQTTTGNTLLQYTADFRLVYHRKQNV